MLDYSCKDISKNENNMEQSLKKRLIWDPWNLGRFLHILVMISFLAQVIQESITVVINTGNATSASIMDVLQFISNHPAPEQAR